MDTETKTIFRPPETHVFSRVRRRLNSIFDLVYFKVADFDLEQRMSGLDTIHTLTKVLACLRCNRPERRPSS
jgi:hypothetical protein